ncbi:MAG: PHP domain-containing protein [Immundisolibacteraceae bacterium]|nr:PHP domain-containing protein [Immundisolibacteraceae bacterium]
MSSRPAVYDLHSHSTFSDGVLTPTELVRRAADKGVTHLALTDHDTLAGIDEARGAAGDCGIELITGVEISVTWQRKPLHIVGLDFDPENSALRALIDELQLIRRTRAEKIASKLAKKGVKDPLENASTLAKDGLISRAHFARCLISQGFAKNFEEAFRYYLGPGKPAFVSTAWVALEPSLQQLHAAGGVAVIAHPRRYRLSHSWMRRLLGDFKQLGGAAVEVVTGNGSSADIESMSQLATRFELLASAGSDFHDPNNSWVELGRLAPVPGSLTPIWSRFNGAL